MATIRELVDSGRLEEINSLEENELPMRYLYGTPEFISWLDESLELIEFDPTYAELEPTEQVDALFGEYSLGHPFSTDRRFKKLASTPDHGIWELKTTDVRIFGFVPEKDKFVCCFGEDADIVKLKNSYGAFIARSRFTLNNLGLDEPPCIMSSEYKDVISD